MSPLKFAEIMTPKLISKKEAVAFIERQRTPLTQLDLRMQKAILQAAFLEALQKVDLDQSRSQKPFNIHAEEEKIGWAIDAAYDKFENVGGSVTDEEARLFGQDFAFLNPNQEITRQLKSLVLRCELEHLLYIKSRIRNPTGEYAPIDAWLREELDLSDTPLPGRPRKVDYREMYTIFCDMRDNDEFADEPSKAEVCKRILSRYVNENPNTEALEADSLRKGMNRNFPEWY